MPLPEEYQLKATPGLIPNFFNIIARGQNPVNAAWAILAPTNAVNHNQFVLWATASKTLSMTKHPAINNTKRSTVITNPLIIFSMSHFLSMVLGF